MRNLAIPLAGALLGCSADGLEPTAGATTQAIIGGRAETTGDGGDANVVALIGHGGRVYCSGTLVSPRMVLSAAHCVLGIDRVAFGPDGADPEAVRAVVRQHAYPGWDSVNVVNDLGLFELAEPAPANVVPARLASAPPVVGTPARFVGYGYTEVGPSGEYGRKYGAWADIESFDATTFSYGVATCNGDSGGPAFLEDEEGEVLAGLTSWGDADCAELGVDTRVDAFRDWIEAEVGLVEGDGEVDEPPVPSDEEEPGTVLSSGCRAAPVRTGGESPAVPVTVALFAFAAWLLRRR